MVKGECFANATIAVTDLFQETPKTCRNFVALAMEGEQHAKYYHFLEIIALRVLRWCYIPSVCLFHLTSRLYAQCSLRVVPNFLVQTGDRTGTGGGGESFYGGGHCSDQDTSQFHELDNSQNPSRMRSIRGFGLLIEGWWPWRTTTPKIRTIPSFSLLLVSLLVRYERHVSLHLVHPQTVPMSFMASTPCSVALLETQSSVSIHRCPVRLELM